MKCQRCSRILRNDASLVLGMGPTCRKKINIQQKNKNHADFSYHLIEHLLIIYDLNLGGKSVTNDIEYVLQDIKTKVLDFDSRKIIYRDSIGFYDQVTLDPENNPIFSAIQSASILEYLKQLETNYYDYRTK